MAKLTYTLNGIQFTDIKVPGHLSGAVVSKAKYTSGGETASTFKGGAIDGIFQTFNAIDIDWNGAKITNTYVNTTGEMLSILQTAYNYATTYTGKTSLTSSSVLGTINGKSLTYGGSITIETGSDYTHPTFSGVTGSYGTTATATLAHGGTFKVPFITVNNNGHITAVKSYTLTLPAAPTTVSGNASTATKLATARTLTIGSSGKTFDGSANVSWSLTEIGAAATSHKHTYTDVGAAAASHTHTYSAVGAAAASHTHTYSAVGAAAANHTHTYSAVGAAAANHKHTEYANAVHSHSNYAYTSHASTATTYGVGTTTNYGHLKISGTYTTQTTAADVALSLGGAYNMYKAFVTRISELAAEIATLKADVATLKGYHAAKPVTAVTVTPETYTLYGKGETAKLSYAITPTDASNKAATWTSDKTAYVTVGSTTGVVTTVAIGSATIKATASDGSGKYDTCAVTVKEARIALLSASDVTATYGGSISRIVPTQTIQSGDGAVFNAGYTYALKSGSTSVSVNNGALTINSAGTSYVIVTSKADTTKTKEVKVTVNKASQTPTISGTTTVTAGSTITLTGSGQGTKSWSSNNTGVATVDASTGVVTGVSYGTATITLSCAGNTNYNSGTKTATITVNRITQTLQASPSSLSWGASDALSAKTVTISGNKTTLSVSSISNSNITATISGTTVTITPKSRGITNATVTISAVETGKYTASSVKITVNVAAAAVNYYWYVGTENPANMTSTTPVVSDTSSPGWRLIGTTVPTYSASNVLWNGDSNGILFSRNYYYIAVPNASIKIYNAANGSVMDSFTTSEATINGVKYTIYASNSKASGFAYKIF